MRSQFASLRTLTLPGGATTGLRWVLDGITGEISGYDSEGRLVVVLTPDRLAIGPESDPAFPSRVTIDPLRGIQVYRTNADGLTTLAGVWSGGNGIELITETGDVMAALTETGYTLVDPDGGEDIVLTNGTLDGQVPEPHSTSGTHLAPGTNIVTPATAPFDLFDLVIRAAGVYVASEQGAQSMTPPAGYTEITDLNTSSHGATHGLATAARENSSSGAATFVSTYNGWSRDNVLTVAVKSSSTASAFVRASASMNFETTDPVVTVDIPIPAGVQVGDIMFGIVSFAHVGGSIPNGYTTPIGWRTLAVTVEISAGHCLAMVTVYKVADAVDVTKASETVIISTDGTLPKLIKSSSIVVGDVALLDAVPDITVGGRSLARGVFFPERFSSSGNAGPYGSSVTDMVCTVPVIANRAYIIHFETTMTYSNSTPSAFVYEAFVDEGLGSNRVGKFADHSVLNANHLTRVVCSDVSYYPTVSADVQVAMIINRRGGAATVTLNGAADARRRLEVRDVGARVSP